MVCAPLLLFAGVLLRIQFHFFFPQQLAAYLDRPVLISAAYSAFLAGNILLWPAIATLARLIGARRPGWALWGGTLALFGLFARTFHAGVDHLAFQIVRTENLELATTVVAESYAAFHIVSAFSAPIMLGWIALAIGANLSGTLGLIRSMSLGLMAALMIGVLKGSSLTSVVATGGLCVALVPLGLQMLCEEPRPSRKAVVGWSLLVTGVLLVFFFLGQAG